MTDCKIKEKKGLRGGIHCVKQKAECENESHTQMHVTKSQESHWSEMCVCVGGAIWALNPTLPPVNLSSPSLSLCCWRPEGKKYIKKDSWGKG